MATVVLAPAVVRAKALQGRNGTLARTLDRADLTTDNGVDGVDGVDGADGVDDVKPDCLWAQLPVPTPLHKTSEPRKA